MQIEPQLDEYYSILFFRQLDLILLFCPFHDEQSEILRSIIINQTFIYHVSESQDLLARPDQESSTLAAKP